MAAPLTGGGAQAPGLPEQIEDNLFERLARPWMTWLLLTAITAIHLGLGAIMYGRGDAGLLGLLAAQRGPNLLIRSGAMRGVRLDDGELWRLVSCVFLHGDGAHLLLNGIALLALGRIAEAIYGPARLLGLFVLSGACGAAFSWLGGNPTSVGASGAIFGLLGAAMIFGWRYRRGLPEQLSSFFRRRLAFWTAFNLVLGFFIPFIDNLGHTGGLVGGCLLATILGNRVVPGEDGPPWPRLALAAGSAALIAFAGWQVGRKWGLWG